MDNPELKILIGSKNGQEANLIIKMSNRHGIITGATGTGKTVTLQTLAEGFSKLGIPVFAADIKGDLSGISKIGSLTDKLSKIISERKIQAPIFQANPVQFWDIFGEQGTSLRATISDLGPVLLSKLLNLNDVQEGVLNIAFKYADDNNLLVLDLKDLRSLLTYIANNNDSISISYGNVTSQTVGSIQRALLVLENQGLDKFFGQPELNIADLIRIDPTTNKGYVNLLDATKLISSPQAYSSFLLWLLSELFENLPEVGDLEKPKLIFFFDEAHLLFNDTSKALLEKIIQVVKLIRSKGVGIYFITQNPMDIPEEVLAQLGNRIQHALRAYTPMEQKAVKAAANAFRANPDFDTYTAITSLDIGEALISCLDIKGAPTIVERVFIQPPGSQIGIIEPELKSQLINTSALNPKYQNVLDVESAYEKLAIQQKELEKQAQEAAEIAEEEKLKERSSSKKSTRMGPGERFVNNILGSIGREVGNKIVRGVLGGILGGRK
jgi:DNA helicase HerA-like ATPase